MCLCMMCAFLGGALPVLPQQVGCSLLLIVVLMHHATRFYVVFPCDTTNVLLTVIIPFLPVPLKHLPSASLLTIPFDPHLVPDLLVSDLFLLTPHRPHSSPVTESNMTHQVSLMPMGTIITDSPAPFSAFCKEWHGPLHHTSISELH